MLNKTIKMLRAHTVEIDERETLSEQEIIFRRGFSKEIFTVTLGSKMCNQEVINLNVSKCFSCERLTIWQYDTILHPNHLYEIDPNPDLDTDIQSDFNEARAILDLSPRGAAALLRLCVQKLCKQLGKSGKNINDDIASLVKDDGLSVTMQQALDVVRVIGNNSVHPGKFDMKDNRETAALLFRIINSIAYERITHPNAIKEIYDDFPDSIKASIAKRDAKS